jgi:hypothetical protein
MLDDIANISSGMAERNFISTSQLHKIFDFTLTPPMYFSLSNGGDVTSSCRE